MTDPFKQQICTLVGGSGFIGAKLALQLVSVGKVVRILDIQSPSDYILETSGIEFIQGDVCNPQAVKAATQGADLVVNLAGVVGVQAAHDHAAKAYNTAVQGTTNVLAQFAGPVVLFSSSSVYGLHRPQAVDEHVRVDLADARSYDSGVLGYAAGKLHMENLGLRARREGRNVVVIRPFNVVGAGQTGAYGMVLPTFVQQAILGPSIEVYDDGQQLRCFSDVDTFVKLVVELTQDTRSWAQLEPIFNIGADIPIRIIDLAHKVVRLTDTQVPIKFVPYDNKFPGRSDVRSRQPDTKKIDRLLGKQKWLDIDDILRDLIEFERRRVEPFG